MEKEIEVMPFMSREQTKRDINNGMVNSSVRDPLKNEILGNVELQRRKANNDLEKRNIFNETKQVTSNNEKSLDIKTISKVALASLVIGGIIILCKESTYENKPIKYVTREMAMDSGLERTDDGKKFTGKMSQEELVNYAIEHELTIEQIEEEITNYSKKNHLDNDFVSEKMEEDNPEIFKRL